MAKPRYKTPSCQRMYESMLAAAQDKGSELYYNGKPHRGAAHRTAFWDGYAGFTKTANVIPGTQSAVCFAAGKTFAKTNPGIAAQDAVWTLGGDASRRAIGRGAPHAQPCLTSVNLRFEQLHAGLAECAFWTSTAAATLTN